MSPTSFSTITSTNIPTVTLTPSQTPKINSGLNSTKMQIDVNADPVRGLIMYLASEKSSQEINLYHSYHFSISDPGDVNIIFTTDIRSFYVEIFDPKGNRIMHENLSKSYMPRDFYYLLDKGTYNIDIYKRAPVGGFGVTLGDDNVGEYTIKVTHKKR